MLRQLQRKLSLEWGGSTSWQDSLPLLFLCEFGSSMVVFDGLYKIMLALSSAKYNYNACQARQALEWSRVREQVPSLKHQKLILSAKLLNTNVAWNVWGTWVCEKEELTIRLSKLCCLYVCKSVSCYRTTSHLLTHWKRKSCPLVKKTLQG